MPAIPHMPNLHIDDHMVDAPQEPHNLCHDEVVTIGETTLSIRRSEIGTRSIRSGAVMAMYLAGVPVFSIMLIGRWSSTAFLKYIRKQVQEFLQAYPQK